MDIISLWKEALTFMEDDYASKKAEEALRLNLSSLRRSRGEVLRWCGQRLAEHHSSRSCPGPECPTSEVDLPLFVSIDLMRKDLRIGRLKCVQTCGGQMKSLLRNGATYQMFQVAVGAFSARVSMMRRYLHVQAGQRVIDIGCGPGHILTKMPEGVVYDGFDTECGYIDFANQHFGRKGRFHCRIFDLDAVSEFGPVDIVTMNGVLHHMDDDLARTTVSLVEKVLKPGGTFFALDGVYTVGQGAIAKWFLDNDRGKFVRTEEAYRAIFLASFPSCEISLHDDLLRIPYSIAISLCRKAGQST